MIFQPSHPTSTTSPSTTPSTISGEPRSALGRLRPWIIALFAVLLLARAGFADSFPHDPIMQWDNTTTIANPATDHAEAFVDSVPITNGRVQSVEVYAATANFDRDADPDGWRANLIIRNRHDQIITPRANVRFELIDRLADQDSSGTIRWSMPVKYDEQGQAYFQLRLRGDDARKLQSRKLQSRQWRPNTRWSQSPVSDPQIRNHKVSLAVRGDFFRNEWVPAPRVARLFVTVNVPGQGSYRGETTVWVHAD